jgi:hypothetical protein
MHLRQQQDRFDILQGYSWEAGLGWGRDVKIVNINVIKVL